MGSGALAVLYAGVVAAGWAASQAPGAPPPRAGTRPWSTAAALVLVGVPTLVQMSAAPGLMRALGRRPGELIDGQPWRLVTSLVVQDGGWSGTVFNLVYLAVLGVAAERLWGPVRWWAVWLVAGVGAQFWGMAVQPWGAGNSVANFGLAASLAVAALLRGSGPARAAGAASLLLCVVLLAVGDVHGGGAVLGALTGLVVLRVRPLPAGGCRAEVAEP